MFDPSVIEFGGISIIAMVFGLVEFIKVQFDWQGKKVTALAAFLGLGVLGIVEALQFLPPEAVPFAEAVFRSVAFGLAAAGFYKFAARNG
jgi:hypothetical protein